MKQRKQSSTTFPMCFLLVASSDHITPLTGATPSVTISKNGGTFAANAGGSGDIAEIGNGWYKLAGNATDRASVGEFLLHATATGADPVDDRYTIVAWDPFDSAGLGLTNLANPVLTGTAAADALLDETAGVETSWTVRQALRMLLSMAAAKVSGAGTTTITIRDVNDTKNRIVATVDSSGNRTAFTTVDKT